MLVIHCKVALLVVHPMLTIRERTIQAVISRDPVSRLSRKLIMSAEKLFLVLTESLVRLSEHLLPSISVFLAVFNEAAIPLHQPGSVVKNCKNIRISFTQTHKEKKGASALMPRRSFFHFTSAPGGTNSL
jgi:hypothetical protein